MPAGRGPAALLALGSAFAAAFERLTAGGRFDAIVFNQPLSAWAVLGSRAARGVPTLYTFHSPWPMEWAIIGGHKLAGDRLARAGLRLRLEFAARRWIEDRALSRSGAITVLSEFMRSRLEALHPRVSRRKVTLVPGGVDLERFRPSGDSARRARRAALGIPAGVPLLLTVRRMVPRMGLETLLRAFRNLATEVPDLHLAIGGSGPLEGMLRALRGSLGLSDRVRFLGYVPEAALPGLYAAADLFVLPTEQLEGFGLVTVEALACGTPVVGTPVGATPGILAEVDPRLVASGTSPASLSAAAATCLRLPPQELRAIGERGRKRVMDLYDAEKVGDHLEALIASLASRSSGRPPHPRAPRPREAALSAR
jgi:glycosyltransferase involved in cell wall biosynthesis